MFGLNNVINNLQIITTRENTIKDNKEGTSKYAGVGYYKSRNNWRARAFINGVYKTIG